MSLSRGSRSLAQLQERDYADLREELSTVKDNINSILQMHRLAEVESVMQTLQMVCLSRPLFDGHFAKLRIIHKELRNEHDYGLQPELNMQEGLWKLHKGSRLLPPSPDCKI